MKIADISFPHDGQYNHLKNWILGKPYPSETEEVTKILRSLIRRSADTDDLINRIVESEELKGTRVRAETIRQERPDKAWKEIRAAMGEACFKTDSDAGAVRVGSENFSVLIRNGRGDGTTRVAVFDEIPASLRPFLGTVMGFEISLDGSCSIYNYDCTGGEPIRQLNGRYGVYSYDGLVVFEKWN